MLSLAKDATDQEIHERGHQERRPQEVSKDKHQSYTKSVSEPICVGQAPGESGEKEEEGEDVRERWIGPVV